MPVAIATSFLTLLFSLGFGQTAYLNVLAQSAATTTLPDAAPALRSTMGICDVTLTFFDGQSNQLKTKEVWINPGSSTALSIPPAGGPTAVRGTGLLYGEVALLSDSDSTCTLIPSLEITGPDGNTKVLLPLETGRIFSAS